MAIVRSRTHRRHPSPRSMARQGGVAQHGALGPNRRAPAGFSLLELLIVVVIVAIVTAIGIPLYRGHAATARDAALVERMTTMTVFQEDVRLRTGTYGSGVYDAASNIDTLATAIGWRPSADDGTVYSVTADGGTSWTVTATDANGRQLCRIFPAGEPCP